MNIGPYLDHYVSQYPSVYTALNVGMGARAPRLISLLAWLEYRRQRVSQMTPFWTHFGDIPGVWIYLIPRISLYSR